MPTISKSALLLLAASAASAAPTGSHSTLRPQQITDTGDEGVAQIHTAMATLSADKAIPATYISCVNETLLALHSGGGLGEPGHGADGQERACASVSGNVCGSITDDVEQMRYYMKRAAGANVRTVCETGFYRGESAALWLCAGPDVTLQTFDLEFQSSELSVLKERFGERITNHEGDSTKTLPAFFNQTSAPCCDIAVADGGHEAGVPLADLRAYKEGALRPACQARGPTLVLIDEILFRTPGSEPAQNFLGMPISMDFSSTADLASTLQTAEMQALQCCGFSRGAYCSVYTTHAEAPAVSPFTC